MAIPHERGRQQRQTANRATAKRARLQLPEIRRTPIGDLRVLDNNARAHPDRQIRQLAASIKSFGFLNPILVDEAGQVLAGHGRLEAAKLLGLEDVPTLCVDHLTAPQKRAYAITDNRLAELAEWNRDRLRIEIGDLAEIEFPVELTGFSTGEIDLLLDSAPRPPEPEPAEVLECPSGPPCTTLGDLWMLGPHRILCGDARDAHAYRRLLGDVPAQMVFSDPPYNVAIRGHAVGRGKVRHREFAMASGEMTASGYQALLGSVIDCLVHHSLDGSIHYLCIDWRHLPDMLEAGSRRYTEWKNLVVWNKDNGGQGSFYRSKHELVAVFKKGTAAHINNFELGQHGRYRTNVWDYPSVNSLNPARRGDLELHPTVKPIALVADAIRDCSRRNGIILDPFGGSGTTLLAAERTGRIARLIEIDPLYVDLTIRRWQDATGEAARHAETGEPFGLDEAAAPAPPGRRKPPSRRLSR